MTYTLRQVKPMLSAPELELFQLSRQSPIKSLSPKQLASKITRARALRDKYRDIYRRQTVAVNTGPARLRKPLGGENQRTQLKADVMEDVLSRFEAQSEKLQALRIVDEAKRGAVRHHNAPGAPTKRTNPKVAQRSRRTQGDATPAAGADLAMRGATSTGKRQIVRLERAAESEAQKAVKARGNVSTRAGRNSTAGAVTGAPAKKQPVRKPGTTPITDAKRPAAALVKAVRKAVAKKDHTTARFGSALPSSASKTLVGGAPSKTARGAVPTNMPAVATRLDPLKAKPINKKIHAAARGKKQRFEAARDAR